MLNVNATNFVTAINHNDPREKLLSDEITEELRAISKLLKEGLQGLGSWIQTYAMESVSKEAFFEESANELNQASALFSSGYSLLSTYLQQFPYPADYEVARQMEKILETLLQNDLARETQSSSGSWGETIHPKVGMDWSSETTQQFTESISQISWKASKELIYQAQDLLP